MDRLHTEQLEEAREPEPGVGHGDHSGGSGSHGSLELAGGLIVVLQMLHYLAAQSKAKYALLEEQSGSEGRDTERWPRADDGSDAIAKGLQIGGVDVD